MFSKGDAIEVTKNPYAGMLDVPVGTRGVITSGGTEIVGVKLSSGLKAKAWLVNDGQGERTIKRI